MHLVGMEDIMEDGVGIGNKSAYLEISLLSSQDRVVVRNTMFYMDGLVSSGLFSSFEADVTSSFVLCNLPLKS